MAIVAFPCARAREWRIDIYTYLAKLRAHANLLPSLQETILP